MRIRPSRPSTGLSMQTGTPGIRINAGGFRANRQSIDSRRIAAGLQDFVKAGVRLDEEQDKETFEQAASLAVQAQEAISRGDSGAAELEKLSAQINVPVTSRTAFKRGLDRARADVYLTTFQTSLDEAELNVQYRDERGFAKSEEQVSQEINEALDMALDKAGVADMIRDPGIASQVQQAVSDYRSQVLGRSRRRRLEAELSEKQDLWSNKIGELVRAVEPGSMTTDDYNMAIHAMGVLFAQEYREGTPDPEGTFVDAVIREARNKVENDLDSDAALSFLDTALEVRTRRGKIKNLDEFASPINVLKKEIEERHTEDAEAEREERRYNREIRRGMRSIPTVYEGAREAVAEGKLGREAFVEAVAKHAVENQFTSDPNALNELRGEARRMYDSVQTAERNREQIALLDREFATEMTLRLHRGELGTEDLLSAEVVNKLGIDHWNQLMAKAESQEDYSRFLNINDAFRQDVEAQVNQLFNVSDLENTTDENLALETINILQNQADEALLSGMYQIFEETKDPTEQRVRLEALAKEIKADFGQKSQVSAQQIMEQVREREQQIEAAMDLETAEGAQTARKLLDQYVSADQLTKEREQYYLERLALQEDALLTAPSLFIPGSQMEGRENPYVDGVVESLLYEVGNLGLFDEDELSAIRTTATEAYHASLKDLAASVNPQDFVLNGVVDSRAVRKRAREAAEAAVLAALPVGSRLTETEVGEATGTDDTNAEDAIRKQFAEAALRFQSRTEAYRDFSEDVERLSDESGLGLFSNPQERTDRALKLWDWKARHRQLSTDARRAGEEAYRLGGEIGGVPFSSADSLAPSRTRASDLRLRLRATAAYGLASGALEPQEAFDIVADTTMSMAAVAAGELQIFAGVSDGDRAYLSRLSKRMKDDTAFATDVIRLDEIDYGDAGLIPLGSSRGALKDQWAELGKVADDNALLDSGVTEKQQRVLDFYGGTISSIDEIIALHEQNNLYTYRNLL